MKHLLFVLLCLSGTLFSASAADGYTLKLKFTDAANQKVFLAHYYGKPLPTIYKVDSAMLDGTGTVIMKTPSKIIGGLYMIIMQDNTTYFDFLLENGQSLEMIATASRLPIGVTFVNNPQNDEFIKYVTFLNKIGAQDQEIQKELAGAKNSKDSASIRTRSVKLTDQVRDFRRDIMKRYPNTLLYNIFKALEQPAMAEGKHLLPDGKEDTDYNYRYYKAHFWDNYNFADERLVYTPLLDAKLDEYFKRLVLAQPDSFNKDADIILAKAETSKETFKYIMHWLTGYVQESTVMGMDASFVHLVENYHMRGKAFWLNQGTLNKYIERAQKIAPNVIGNTAPDLEMMGMDGKTYNLNDIKAKYTVLVFWAPDCGHCRDEIPRIDSVYKAENLAAKGVKLVGFDVDADPVLWKKLVEEKQLKDWLHVHDPENKSKFRSKYDVYGTPSIYLLDSKKVIRGKKLDHTNITQVVQMMGEIEESLKSKAKTTN